MIDYYDEDVVFESRWGKVPIKIEVIDKDTFTAAAEEEFPCCLNFASHKRPGGGYKAVRNLRMPIKTQEEDLFRRSNLPEIMDTEEIRSHYPLTGRQGFYCEAIVNKDANLDEVPHFKVGVVTVPALVNPKREQRFITEDKVKRILYIADHHNHDTLILGAWGCGVFGNDPKNIAGLFRKHLENGPFVKVVFAIPGSHTENFKVFQEAFGA